MKIVNVICCILSVCPCVTSNANEEVNFDRVCDRLNISLQRDDIDKGRAKSDLRALTDFVMGRLEEIVRGEEINHLLGSGLEPENWLPPEEVTSEILEEQHRIRLHEILSNTYWHEMNVLFFSDLKFIKKRQYCSSKDLIPNLLHDMDNYIYFIKTVNNNL